MQIEGLKTLARLVLGFALLLAADPGDIRARAEASGPDFFRVVGVVAGDVLNIRADAGASHAKIGEIPADADSIRNLGCIGGLSFAEWQKSSEEERAAGAKTRWCKIEYAGVQGWVAGWYLGEGSAPAGESVTAVPPSWRIVEVGGSPAEGEPEIGFQADGSFSGSTGCNRFQGRMIIEDGRLLVQGPMAATRMACPGGRLDAQESDIFAILDSGPEVEFDPRIDEMVLVGGSDGLAMRLARGQ